MIETKEVFVTRGKQFDSQEKAERYRADLIGEFMDKAPILLHPGDKIKLNDFLVSNRKQLINLLEY